ncbi:MAG: LysE family transporter [Candidatus Hodarchaeales archaeon]
MGVVEILVVWFLLSFTGALAPGPLSAAVIMQTNKRGRLHGMLPMVGHSIVELGIVVGIIVSVQAIILDPFTTSILIGFGGIVIVIFGLLALRDYRFTPELIESKPPEELSVLSVVEATTHGATVSIFSPYFLLWWFAIGLANVTMLVGELQVGVGTLFLAAILIYFTHISTDFLFGAFLAVGTDKASKKATVGGINWINVGIGLFQIVLGVMFVFAAFG